MPNEPSWKIEDTVKLSGILAEHGVDLIDVSSGGNHPSHKIKIGMLAPSPAYQAHFAEAVRRVHGVDGEETKRGKPAILVGAVGGITTGTLGNQVLEADQADVVLLGRQFLKEPGSVSAFADELGVQIKLSNQYEWAFKGRGYTKAFYVQRTDGTKQK